MELYIKKSDSSRARRANENHSKFVQSQSTETAIKQTKNSTKLQ